MATTTADCLFADSYAYFEQGLCYDEVNNKEEAKKMYEKGLEICEQALKLKDATKKELYKGLMEVKWRVLERLNDINSKHSDINSTQVQQIRESLQSTTETKDIELYYWLPDGVQLVTIEGEVTNAPSPPASLAIFKIDAKEFASEQNGQTTGAPPAALIQVGPWAYPLIPGQSTIMKNELGVYVLPNPAPEHPNMFVGIILPRGIEKRLEDEFVYALEQFATLKTSEVVQQMSSEQRQKTSDRIAEFLIQTGQSLAQRAQDTANWTGKYIAEKGESYRATIPPESHGGAVNINPMIRHGFFILHKGSKVVAKVTKTVLDKIGDVGIAVGRKVANSLSGDSSGGQLFQSTFTVVGGGLTAVSTVWISLEEASKTLMRSIADESVQTVQLRYGDEASETMHHAIYAVGHTTLAGFQLYEFGPRSIAGRMARKAGLQFVREVGAPRGSVQLTPIEQTQIVATVPKEKEKR